MLNIHIRQPTSYVSPSDDIMSPCTKKLSDIKGKRFKKYVFSIPDYVLLSVIRNPLSEQRCLGV